MSLDEKELHARLIVNRPSQPAHAYPRRCVFSYQSCAATAPIKATRKFEHRRALGFARVLSSSDSPRTHRNLRCCFRGHNTRPLYALRVMVDAANVNVYRETNPDGGVEVKRKAPREV